MLISQPIAKRTYLFEVQLGTIALQKKINLVYNSELDNIAMYGLVATSATQTAASPSANAVVSNAGLASLLLTLSVGDDEQIYNYPMYNLNPANVSGMIQMFDNKRINIPKSYVTIISTSNLNNNDSVMLNWIFERLAK